MIWKFVTYKHFRLAREGEREDEGREKGGRWSDFYK